MFHLRENTIFPLDMPMDHGHGGGGGPTDLFRLKLMEQLSIHGFHSTQPEAGATGAILTKRLT